MPDVLRQPKDIFKQARIKYFKLNQREMSKKLDKGQSVYAKYETGETIPPSHIMILLMNQISTTFGKPAVNDLLFAYDQASEAEPDLLELQNTLLKLKGTEHKKTREHLKFLLEKIATENN